MSEHFKIGRLRLLLSYVYLFIFILYAGGATWNTIDNEAFYLANPTTVPYTGYLVRESNFDSIFVFLGIFYAFYALMAQSLIRNRNVVNRGPIFFFVVFAGSALWSIDAKSTILASILYMNYIIMACIAVGCIGFDKSMRFALLVSTAIVVLSALLAAIGDSHAIMFGYHAGKWRGIFNHKNVFGPFCGILLISMLQIGKRVGIGTRIRTLAIASSVVGLVFSASSTAEITVLLTLLIIVIQLIPLKAATQRILIFSYVALVITVCSYVVYENIDEVARFFGRDSTFSNRGYIWAATEAFLSNHFLGFGFGTQGGSELLDFVRNQVNWDKAFSLHSAYYALAVDVGWGITFIFIAWLLSPVTFVLNKNSSPEQIYLACLSVFCFSSGLGEVTSAPRSSLSWLFYLMALMKITKDASEKRAHQRLRSASKAEICTNGNQMINS